MAQTFGDVRQATLKLLDEITSAGTISTTGDVTSKIQTWCNAGMVELASTAAKIHGEHYIVHAPVCNELNRDTSLIKTFLPGGADISISLVNALSCFFEITGPATVVIEEAAAGSSVYTPIETITVAGTVTTFTEYRRLITPTLPTNTVRLRFTGSYVFRVRNYILYPYTWPTEAEVQQHRPWFIYDLPADLLMEDRLQARKEVRQYSDYDKSLYRLTLDNKLAVNRYDAPLEFVLRYFRIPTPFTFTGVEATDDAQAFGIVTTGTPTYRISDEAAMILPHYIAGHILNSEGGQGEQIGANRINYFYLKASQLSTNQGSAKGTVLSVPAM